MYTGKTGDDWVGADGVKLLAVDRAAEKKTEHDGHKDEPDDQNVNGAEAGLPERLKRGAAAGGNDKHRAGGDDERQRAVDGACAERCDEAVEA